jgi:hypothetical protein
LGSSKHRWWPTAACIQATQIASRVERHFRMLEPLTGEPALTLLPADADCRQPYSRASATIATTSSARQASENR